MLQCSLLCFTFFYLFHFLDSKPTLKQLRLIKIESRTIKITESVCKEWRKIGELLDFDDSGNRVTIIGRQTNEMETCLTEVWQLWLNGESRDYQPASWRNLIELLKESGHSVLAAELDNHFL